MPDTRSPQQSPTAAPAGIDPRGPRVAASITCVVLALVLATAPSTFATALLAVQAAVFVVGATAGVQRTPYAWFFRRAVRPRLDPPTATEDPRPPRFAQTVGLAFTVVGLLGLLTGGTVLGLAAVGLALVAALLNAVFDYCLGCEMYLRLQRLQPAR